MLPEKQPKQPQLEEPNWSERKSTFLCPKQLKTQELQLEEMAYQQSTDSRNP